MPDDLASKLNLAQVRPGLGPPAGANDYPARGAGPPRKPIGLSSAPLPEGGVPKTTIGPSLLGPRDPLGDYRRGMAPPEPGELKPSRAAQRLTMDPHMESRLGQVARPGGGYAPPPGEVPPLGGPAPLSAMEKMVMEHAGTPAFEPPPSPPMQGGPAARPPMHGTPAPTQNPAVARQLLQDTRALHYQPPGPPPGLLQRAAGAIPAPIRDKVGAGLRSGGRLAGPVGLLVDTVGANSQDLGHTIASGLSGRWLPGEDGQPYRAPDPTFVGLPFGGVADAIGRGLEGHDPFHAQYTDTGPIHRGPYQPSTSPPATSPMGDVMDLFNAGRPGYNKYPNQPDDAEKVPASPSQRLTIPGLPKFPGR